MKKRLVALVLAVCIAVSMLAVPASASSTANTAVQLAITLGAMSTDQTGALSEAVTRGQLAKMLTCFSTYRESTGSQGTVGTLFPDVPGTAANAPYIRIAVQQGWMNGYTDGTFRPDNAVTLEEACTAVLKLMGYKMTELSGAFPNAQLNKAREIGLRDDLKRQQGETMNYEDCALLFYNALRSNASGGGAYGTSLGFTVSNGQVDASSVMLSTIEGPFVVMTDGGQIPFAPLNVYVNDKAAETLTLSTYDVYYYSESLQTVWVYNRKAAGRITAVSPSASAPTAVTVAGSSYTLGSSAAAAQVSSLNGGGVGQVVTLLLGMNNEVASVITGSEADSVFYGVVQSASRNLVDEDGADVRQTVAVACTDGITRSVNVDKSLNYPTGWLVQVTVDENGEHVETIGAKSISGTVNAEGTAIGTYQLADGVEIIDTTTEGVAGTIRPSRISGATLSEDDVRYYTLDENGRIDRLILNDVTGDLWYYGVLDDIKNLAANLSGASILLPSASSSASSSAGSSASSDASSSTEADSSTSGGTTTATTTPISEAASLLMPTTSEILWGVITGDILSTTWEKLTSNTGSLIGIAFRQLADITGTPLKQIFSFVGSGATYICYVNGSQTSFSTSIKYPVVAGGIGVSREVSGTVRSMVQLMPVKIDQLGAASVLSGTTRYETADNMQVYLWYKGQYYATNLASVDTEKYYLTGWYDNFGCAAGKKIRVIIAVRTDE